MGLMQCSNAVGILANSQHYDSDGVTAVFAFTDKSKNNRTDVWGQWMKV